MIQACFLFLERPQVSGESDCLSVVAGPTGVMLLGKPFGKRQKMRQVLVEQDRT